MSVASDPRIDQIKAQIMALAAGDLTTRGALSGLDDDLDAIIAGLNMLAEDFRDREEAVLADLVAQTNVVLSTGGGAILRPANRERLTQGGTVLYLHAAPATLWERTRHSKHRPLLQAPDPLARVQELYALRDALYREVADLVVESDREQVSRLAHRLEQQLRAAARA